MRHPEPLVVDVAQKEAVALLLDLVKREEEIREWTLGYARQIAYGKVAWDAGQFTQELRDRTGNLRL